MSFISGKNIDITRGDLDINLYLSNMFNKSAPRLYDAPDFSFDTRLHDPRGRILGLNIEYNFWNFIGIFKKWMT